MKRLALKILYTHKFHSTFYVFIVLICYLKLYHGLYYNSMEPYYDIVDFYVPIILG